MQKSGYMEVGKRPKSGHLEVGKWSYVCGALQKLSRFGNMTT